MINKKIAAWTLFEIRRDAQHTDDRNFLRLLLAQREPAIKRRAFSSFYLRTSRRARTSTVVKRAAELRAAARLFGVQHALAPQLRVWPLLASVRAIRARRCM